MESEDDTRFFVIIDGQIETGEFMGDNLYCNYCFNHGNDWEPIVGVDGIVLGQTQIAKMGPEGSFVWNFPIHMAFKSTNAFGWPRLVISVYGIDALGRDVIYGYGSILIPTHSGHYDRSVDLYAPMASSLAQRCLNMITGNYPEYYNSKFTAQGVDREVTRVQTTGTVTLQLDVTTRGMNNFGFVASTKSMNVPFTTHQSFMDVQKRDEKRESSVTNLSQSIDSELRYMRPNGTSRLDRTLASSESRLEPKRKS